MLINLDAGGSLKWIYTPPSPPTTTTHTDFSTGNILGLCNLLKKNITAFVLVEQSPSLGRSPSNHYNFSTKHKFSFQKLFTDRNVGLTENNPFFHE